MAADKSKGRDYDESLPGSIPLTFKGKTYEFPPEAPLDVAVEWMDRQQVSANNQPWEQLGETQAEYTVGNMAVVFGEHFEALRADKVGFDSLNRAYADLLDWWGLWRRPARTDHDVALARVETLVGLNIKDKRVRAQIGDLLDEVRERLAELESEVAEDDTEEELAGNPA